MMFSYCTILWTLFAVVDSHSLLTEKKAEDGNSVNKEIVINNLQNQINQETVIRLSLLKQVYSLVNDMINVKNEMAAMKTNAEKVRRSTDNLRHEDNNMLSEIEHMKHDINDTSESLMNVQHEHNKMLNEIEQVKLDRINASEMIINAQHEHSKTLSEIEERMNFNHNDTSKRIVTVQNYIVNVNKSVGLLRNFTDKIKAKYDIQDCLESSHCWLLYSFEYDNSWNGCEGGTQYVKKTNYSSTPYLGVMTCWSTRYKLFLSKTLTGKYHNIADSSGSGEDHCELLGTTRSGVLPRDWRKSPSTQGFYRGSMGQTFSFGTIGYTPNLTGIRYQKWIECGVNIPGDDRVISM